MDAIKKRKNSKVHSKKEKKLKKLINKSDSDSDESEHELSYYLNDRVKLMKEVLKIIKPKKIKSMAPDCMKNMDMGEINSMLLEELLGISNKRLKYIFNGQNLEEDSSSTDPEVDQQPIDLISLDDVTDDDFVIDLDSDNEGEKKKHKKHRPRIKQECKRKKIKKEKHDKTDYDKSPKTSKGAGKDKMDEQNLMSVLELLELQARARAIRSQLALETSKKAEEQEKKEKKMEESDKDDAVIIESPKNIEIVIMSSESEGENSVKIASEKHKRLSGNNDVKVISKSPKKVNDEQNGDTVHQETENNSGEIKSPSESKNNDSNPPEDKNNTQTTSKIINIESVIITPAKTANFDNNTDEDKNTEQTDKESKDDTAKAGDSVQLENEKPKLDNTDTVTTEVKDTKANIYEDQNNATLDEGDGIIINVEPSEMEYIISD